MKKKKNLNRKTTSNTGNETIKETNNTRIKTQQNYVGIQQEKLETTRVINTGKMTNDSDL